MRVFIAHAAPDHEHLERLTLGLAGMPGSRGGAAFYVRDTSIAASGETLTELERSDVLLALMSPDFLASGYCSSQEFAAAIMLHETGCLRIVPVILEPCEWKDSPLGRLKPLPELGTAVSQWQRAEEAYEEIVTGFGAILRYELAASLDAGVSNNP